MSDYLKAFTTNGQTSYEGQKNAGALERANGWTPAPQQAHESAVAYQTRINEANRK